MDLRNASLKDANFSAIARDLCHRVKGAGASGLIVLEQSAQEPIARAWSRAGMISPLLPTAALCTARWLFDTGNLSGDAIPIRTLSGKQEVLVLDSRIFSLCLGTPAAEKIKRSPGSSWFSADASLQKNFIGSSKVQLNGVERDGFSKDPTQHTILLWDGPLPKKKLHAIGGKGDSAQKLLYAGIISRGQMEVHAPGSDALAACGIALAAARSGDFCEQETNCSTDDGFILAYAAADDSVFAAGSVSYCLRGEWWYQDEPAD